MTKILAVTPNPNDGTSWYRSSLPLARMQQMGDDIQFIEYSNNPIGWSEMINFDVLFMQRPYSTNHVRLANQAITLGLKVWIDFDDLLWGIPESNRNYSIYMNEETMNAIIMLAGICSGDYGFATVSTEALKRELEKISPGIRCHVIPNALDDKLLMPDFMSGFSTAEGDERYIGWRGSDTHQEDLLIVKDELMRVMTKHRVMFIGMYPWFLAGSNGWDHVHPGGLIEFFKVIKSMRKSVPVYFVSLADNPFNRCKSNIAYLEAFYAGAITVAPNWEEWQRPGVINYDPGRLEDAIDKAMKMTVHDRRQLWEDAYSYIQKNLTLSVTAFQRKHILEYYVNQK